MGNKSSTSAKGKSNSAASSSSSAAAAPSHSSQPSQHFHSSKQQQQPQQLTAQQVFAAAAQQPSAASAAQPSAAAQAAMASAGSMKENPLVGQWLKNIPLLAKLTDSERAQLGGYLVSRNYADGDTVIRQGEAGEGFFIIARGEVIVTRVSDADGKKSELGRLKDGDFFGETALISGGQRTATVSASGAVQTFYLDRAHFNKLFDHSRLNIQFAKRKAITAEQSDKQGGVTYQPKLPANAIKDKSPAVIQLINAAMKDNVLFMNLDSDHKAQIISEMYKCELSQGQQAIKQGDLGDNLYVVEAGEFSVTVSGKQVANRVKGQCFGELALMYNSPRAATVTATSPAIVWVVDRFTFRRIVTDLSERRFALYCSFLKKVELLTPLAEYERKKIAEALEEVSFPAGHTVFKQGEQGDAMYIVYSGEVRISKQDPSTHEAKELSRCTSSHYFGERALLTSEPRQGTAVATSPVQLLKLDRAAFLLLLGPLEDILKQKVESYKQPSIVKDEKYVFSNKCAYEDLKIMGTLGKGSFGHVQLCVDRKTQTPYALKAVSKQQIVQTGQQGHVMSEKRCMATMNHPFMVKLHATYKDKNRLYFLLDPILGGELFSVLREKTLFDEETARFYAAHVVLVFEYMHDRGTVYRDLKPENLLLDKDGYLKVTDFGFAKQIGDGRTWTLCGTPDYLAPEIVSGKGHGKGVDWWTLGVFIYEMLASYPPFYDEDPMKTYQKIMAGNVAFPAHFSKESVSLIKKLLQHKSSKRYGTLKGGVADIKNHPWFARFDWAALLAKKIKPPIMPKLKSNLDMSNFSDAQNEKHEVEPYTDDGSNWDAEF